ncbi:transposase [Virgibacillus pantothenticus]|uniref:transposase n=1 Tax=Virgibacillus pantothenticus TaxID=1473 RepID=UPI000984D7AC|nr:transposase [Virgibacillus pantothenticus]
MKPKRYNQEFKTNNCRVYRSGTSVSDLNREYGVSEVTIYKWIKALSPVEGSDGLSPTEIAEIQKENLRLQQEVEILKKAMTIFAKK